MSPGIVCFSHGKESGPWGTKIKALAGVAALTSAVAVVFFFMQRARVRPIE